MQQQCYTYRKTGREYLIADTLKLCCVLFVCHFVIISSRNKQIIKFSQSATSCESVSISSKIFQLKIIEKFSFSAAVEQVKTYPEVHWSSCCCSGGDETQTQNSEYFAAKVEWFFSISCALSSAVVDEWSESSQFMEREKVKSFPTNFNSKLFHCFSPHNSSFWLLLLLGREVDSVFSDLI